jgi:transposase
MTVAPAHAGIDIGKPPLDVSLAARLPCRYANDPAGRAALLTALKKLPQPVQVICEPTGGYERDLLAALWAGQPRREPGARRARARLRAGAGPAGQD